MRSVCEFNLVDCLTSPNDVPFNLQLPIQNPLFSGGEEPHDLPVFHDSNGAPDVYSSRSAKSSAEPVDSVSHNQLGVVLQHSVYQVQVSGLRGLRNREGAIANR